MSNASSCPSEFGLERLRLAEIQDPEAAVLMTHVQECRDCCRRLAELSATPAPFDLDSVWRAARVESVPVEAHPSWGRRLAARWVLGLTATAAVATGVVALAVRPGIPTDVSKGSDSWTLTVVVKRRGQQNVQRPASGVRLSAGDQLRFEVTTKSTPGYAAIIGSDSRGVVTPLVPPGGDAVLVRAGRPVVLEGAVELDDAPGAERVDLFGCSQPVAVVELVRSLRGAGTAGCYQETFWIEKVKP